MSVSGSGTETSIRILLVDRNPAGAAALAASLGASLLGAPDIAAVHAIRDAVDTLRASRFDILLVDLESASESGDGAAVVARLVRLAPGALVIALSDGQSVTATLAALSSGAHDHVARPVDGTIIATRIAELARRHGRHIPVQLAGGGETYSRLVDASGQLRDVLDLVTTNWPGSSENLDGLARRIVDMFGHSEAPRSAMQPVVLPMWRQEQRIIEEAISSFGGNITMAAQALELSPSTIYRKRQAWAEMDGKKGAA